MGKRRSGIAGWNKSLINVMMAGQVSGAQSQAKLLLGKHFHRINFQANRGQFSLDDARPESVAMLAGLGASVARSKEHRDYVTEHFLNGDNAEPFVPYRRVQG